MRIEALTFFRFLAALTVVFYHFGRDLKVPDFVAPFLTLGPEMVTFFFVLSGFVMMVSNANKKALSARKYYVARIARIYPVYLLALVWATAIYFGKPYLWDYGFNDLKALFLSLTLTQSWFPPYPLCLNDPAWSLSVEAFFYLLFPWLFLAIRTSGISGKGLIFWAVGFYLATQVVLAFMLKPPFYEGLPSTSHDLLYYFPVLHLCSFVLGMAGGHVFVRNAHRFHKKGWGRFLLFVGASMGAWGALHFQGQIEQWSVVSLAFDTSFYSLIFLVFIMSVAYSDNRITRWFSSAPFVLLGNASYALYIFQKPAHAVFQKFIAEHVGASPGLQFGWFVVFLVLLSVGSYFFIERVGRRFVTRVLG